MEGSLSLTGVWMLMWPASQSPAQAVTPALARTLQARRCAITFAKCSMPEPHRFSPPRVTSIWYAENLPQSLASSWSSLFVTKLSGACGREAEQTAELSDSFCSAAWLDFIREGFGWRKAIPGSRTVTECPSCPVPQSVFSVFQACLYAENADYPTIYRRALILAFNDGTSLIYLSVCPLSVNTSSCERLQKWGVCPSWHWG